MTDDRRPVEVSAEVTGTPEEVWRLIATGPGVSTWFVPADVEPRVGGTIVQRHGATGAEVSHGTITVYDPPRRFAYEESFEGRTMATEFLVEAQSGGTCVVRIVTHGLTAGDAGFESGLVSGWTQALAVLRVHLASFAGRPAASSRLWTFHDAPLDEAWTGAMRRIGLEHVRMGDRVERLGHGHPPLAGVVELVQPHGVVVRVAGDHAGVLSLIATDFGGRTAVVVDRYVYGDDAAGGADAERRAWESALAPR
jgi:uncharacterized protein YndB with AHSA1/START domain